MVTASIILFAIAAVWGLIYLNQFGGDLVFRHNVGIENMYQENTETESWSYVYN